MRRFAHTINGVPSVRGASATALKYFARCVSSDVLSSKIVLGKVDRGVRSSNFSNTSMTDIASSNHVYRINSHSCQLPAGDVLGVMDVCAGNVAQMHCTGSRRFGKDSEGNAATSVCTVAVDQTPFMRPVLNGDMVVVEGRAIHVGSSSVGVAVEVSRLQFPTRKKTLVCNSFFTMVAIDDKLRKVDVVPALELSTERDVLLNRQYLKNLELSRMSPQKRLFEIIHMSEKASSPSAVPTEMGTTSRKSAEMVLQARDYAANLSKYSSSSASASRDLSPSVIECPPNKAKVSKVSFEATKTEANRVFFPQYLNMNYTIFGGELMRWMEAHALQCGRMFSANRDVRTLGMYNVTFNDAVHVQDWVTLECHVVYVHGTTMEIEVKIVVERADKKVVTNSASFVLANFDDAGQLIEIPNGLQLEGASPEWLARYADARARYEVGRLSRNRLENAFNLPRE